MAKTTVLPNWLMKGYSKLWLKHKTKEFRFKEFEKVFKELKTDNAINNALSIMKKRGWITSSREGNVRKYRLVDIQDIIKFMAKAK